MTDGYRGLEHGPTVGFFFETVTALNPYRIQDRSVITGSWGSWGKHAEYKFRAIADGSAAEIGQTGRWVQWE